MSPEEVAQDIKTISYEPLFYSSMEGRTKYTLAEAYQYCVKLAKNHYENFPVASLAIPKIVRPHIAAVYAFARTADDFADEAQFDGVRMARLKEWETQLKNINDAESNHPVFMALKETIRQFNIPVTLLGDLLTAFKMDVVVSRYQSFSQLMNYCRYSANPVGRLVLYIMGYPAPKFLEYSDSICTALQLANFWQDVTVDLKKNRVYLPKEDLARFHYSEEDLFGHRYDENFRRLMAFEVGRTLDLFNQGKSLCAKAPGRLGFELRLTWLGGVRILKKILKSKGNVFKERPVLGKKDYFLMLTGAINKKAFV